MDKTRIEFYLQALELLKQASSLVGNPCTNISGSTDFACQDWQEKYKQFEESLLEFATNEMANTPLQFADSKLELSESLLKWDILKTVLQFQNPQSANNATSLADKYYQFVNQK